MALRRHYFVLPSQKANILKNQLFLDLQNRGEHSQPLSSRLERQIGMRRESRLTRTETHRGTTSETSAGGETTAVTDELLKALCIQLWKLKSPGEPSHMETPTVFWDLTPGVLPGFTVNMGEKSSFPHVSSGRSEGKKISWNMLEYSVLFRACPQGKLVN